MSSSVTCYGALRWKGCACRFLRLPSRVLSPDARSVRLDRMLGELSARYHPIGGHDELIWLAIIFAESTILH